MRKKVLFIVAAVAFAMPAVGQKMPRHEVSVSYGAAPVTDWIDSYSDMLTGIFTGESSDLDGWGAVTVGYNFRLTGSFSLGAEVVYSSNAQKFRRTKSTIDNRYWSVMPHAKWCWLNLRIFSLYSRVGVGATFSKSKAVGKSDSTTQFAFQVSPVGIEVGGRLAAFAEGGIGVSGCFLIGARYRF